MASSLQNQDSGEEKLAAEIKERLMESINCAFKSNLIIIFFVLFLYSLLIKYEMSGGYFNSIIIAFSFMPFFLASALNYYRILRLEIEENKGAENEEDRKFFTEEGKKSLLEWKWLHHAVFSLPTLLLILWFINCRMILIWQDSLQITFYNISLFSNNFFLVAYFSACMLILFRANYVIRLWINPVRPHFSRKKLWHISILFLFWLFCFCFYMFKTCQLDPHPLIFFLFGVMYLIAIAALHPTPYHWRLFRKNRSLKLKMVRWLPTEHEVSLSCPFDFSIPSLGFFEGPSLFMPILTTCGNVYPLHNAFLLETIEKGKSEYTYTLLHQLENPKILLISSMGRWHELVPENWEFIFCDDNLELFWSRVKPYLKPPEVTIESGKWVMNTRQEFLLNYTQLISVMVESIALEAKKNKDVEAA
ncbi:hypothetical protein ACFL35_03220 [Candidatus Riflebacteria bacterium]